MRTLAYCLFRPRYLILVLGCVLSLMCGCQRSARNGPSAVSPSSYPPVEVYSQFGWINAGNERARLSDYKGKVLVLDFYATWCEPCRQSIPRLNTLHQRYGPGGLEIVGLNVGGPDDRIKVNDFVKQLQIEYPLGFPDKSLTDLFLADEETIPQTFVFARSGQLAKRFIGYEKTTSADLETVIKLELEKEP